MATDSPSRAGLRGVGWIAPWLVSADFYKRNQGRRVRQMTTWGLMLLVAWGLYVLAENLKTDVFASGTLWIATVLPVLLGLAAGWLIFRLVWGWPKFSDFLIATEAEMAKVSWSNRQELKQATVVVLTMVGFIAIYLLAVDVIWSWLLQQIGVLMRPEVTDQFVMVIQNLGDKFPV